MTNDMSGPAPIAVFLSYAQIDDEGLGFVDAFRRDLAFYCSADHGRRVEVFYDRASLGWGDEWRSRIRDAVEGALVFLPLVTLTYFERRWCREELLQFYSSARSREVVDLLLPVVVLGHEHITADNPDTAVQIIAGRQQFDFREAAIAGAGSPVWRSTMLRLAGELVAAAGKAEARLAPTPLQDRDRLAAAVRSSGQRLGRVIGELTASMTALLPDLERVVDGGLLPADLEPAGRRLAHHGVTLERAALDLDGNLRAYVDLVMATGTPDQRAALMRDLGVLGASTVPLDQMGDLCGEFLEALRPVESLSVPLRRAIGPTRSGLLAVRTAVGIIRGWALLGGSL